MAKLYKVSCTKRDGSRVKDQLYTAEFLSKIVSDMESWGCKDIEIREAEAEQKVWLAFGGGKKDNYYAVADNELDAASELINVKWKDECTIPQSIRFYSEIRKKLMDDNFPNGWFVIEVPFGRGTVI